MKSLFRIADGTLVPDEDRATAWLRRQKTEFVQVEHTGVRSPQQLKLYWKLLNKAFDTLPEGSAIATVEHLHARLKCSLGYCTEIRKSNRSTMKAHDLIDMVSLLFPARMAEFSALKNEIQPTFKVKTQMVTETIIQVPESIGLGNMDPDEFNKFFDAAQKLLADTLGVTVDELETDEERMMGGI